MIIRQDWLDNLGLKAPTNMDEFEAVIKAFTEDDPDGNGQKDTMGLPIQAVICTIPDGCQIPCLSSRQIPASSYRAHGARMRTVI